MIKEFVQYEHALNLKEIGFNEPCLGYYELGDFIFLFTDKQENEIKLNCSAPLYQQVFDWFMNKGYIYNIYSQSNDGLKWFF